MPRRFGPARAVGSARQAQHRLPPGLHPRAASGGLPAGAGRAARLLGRQGTAHGDQSGRDRFRSRCRRRCCPAPCCRRARRCRWSWDRSAMRVPRAWRTMRESTCRCSTSSRRGSRPRRSPSYSSAQLGFQAQSGRRDVLSRPRAHATARASRDSRPCTTRSRCSRPCPWTNRPNTWCRASSRRASCRRRWTTWCTPGSAATRHGSRTSSTRSGATIPRSINRCSASRNRKWLPKIEALLNDDKNYLVIVGTGHLVGRGSVIELLKKDGVGATQR